MAPVNNRTGHCLRTAALACILLAVSSCTRTTPAAEIWEISLRNQSTPQLVDTLYDFAKKNRLSVDWFGQYAAPDADQWFERSNQSEDSYNITIFLLSIDIGYVTFTSLVPGKVKAAVHSPDPAKDEWLLIVADLKAELEAQGLLEQ